MTTFKPNELAMLAIVGTVCLCLLVIVASPLFGVAIPEATTVFVFGIVTASAGAFLYNKGSAAGEQKTLNTLATLSAQSAQGTLSVATTAPNQREKAERALRVLTAKSGAFTQMKSESQGRP